VLNAIYKEDFLGFSYGFRPKRSQHDALDALIVGITSKKVNYVLDADIRSFIKGQKYVLLSHKENLTPEGKRSLKLLLKANKRLNTAYLLRETFDQLWDYNSEGWARRFFDNWKAQLRWQRLGPYEKFAAMIERH
jgi:hypothetical protein